MQIWSTLYENVLLSGIRSVRNRRVQVDFFLFGLFFSFFTAAAYIWPKIAGTRLTREGFILSSQTSQHEWRLPSPVFLFPLFYVERRGVALPKNPFEACKCILQELGFRTKCALPNRRRVHAHTAFLCPFRGLGSSYSRGYSSVTQTKY